MAIRYRVGVVLAVLGLLMTMNPAAFAAAKAGCPAGPSGWTEETVEYVADTIWAGLLDPSAFGEYQDFAELVAAEDANGDGQLCLKIMWGETLNPNSHWYKLGMSILGSPTELFTTLDNNANASNR